MNKLLDLLYDAFNDGLNKKLLLQALQMPDDIFQDKLELNGFDPEESRIINKLIKNWRKNL